MHCFVCYEETTDQCACACKAHVHRACLLKTIEVTRSTNCTICVQPIQNVTNQPQRRVARWVVCSAAALATTALFGCLSSILLLALAVDNKNSDSFYDLLTCCISSIGVSTLASGCCKRILQECDLVVVSDVYRYI